MKIRSIFRVTSYDRSYNANMSKICQRVNYSLNIPTVNCGEGVEKCCLHDGNTHILCSNSIDVAQMSVDHNYFTNVSERRRPTSVSIIRRRSISDPNAT